MFANDGNGRRTEIASRGNATQGPGGEVLVAADQATQVCCVQVAGDAEEGAYTTAERRRVACHEYAALYLIEHHYEIDSSPTYYMERELDEEMVPQELDKQHSNEMKIFESIHHQNKSNSHQSGK